MYNATLIHFVIHESAQTLTTTFNLFADGEQKLGVYDSCHSEVHREKAL